MKKVFVILGMLLSLGLFWACSSDENNGDDDKVMVPDGQETRETRMPLFSIKDVPGQMAYSDTKEWHIMCGVPNTYDSVNDYYPSELSDEFKVEGLEVVISGDIYEEDTIHFPRCGGQEVYFIELTKIEKAK
ncbi:MAG: hypothetical protein J6W38_07100 [Prevotella sp.]|nr:hypothetical protein [Prevotella sp.]